MINRPINWKDMKNGIAQAKNNKNNTEIKLFN